MPIGMSRFGFFASWAAVETASKPIYAKKTTPPALKSRVKPHIRKESRPRRAENAQDAAVVVSDALRSHIGRWSRNERGVIRRIYEAPPDTDHQKHDGHFQDHNETVDHRRLFRSFDEKG